MIIIKYIIIKQFRDSSGMRLSGELIELSSSRAAALRGAGLIGGEYVPPEPKGDNSTGDGTTDAGGKDETQAELTNHTEEGEVNGPKGDNSTGDGTTDAGGSEAAPKNRRNRR